MAEQQNRSPISIIIGFWTGVVVWIILMTAFRWWRVWWAYFPLVGTLIGAIQQTADYLHQRNSTPQSLNSPSPPFQQGQQQIPEGERSPVRQTKFCSNCGSEIEINETRCPYCGNTP